MKAKPIRTIAIQDPVGTSDKTPEEELAEAVEQIERIVRPRKLRVTEQAGVSEDMDAELVIFDFGGMWMGNSLMQDNSRRLIRWMQDHPSSLVVVISSFTYRHGLAPELEDLGLVKSGEIRNWRDEDAKQPHEVLPNLVVIGSRLDDRSDEMIRAWFCEGQAPAEPEPEKTPKLPALKFFEPNERFADAMSGFSEPIFDVGAGVGHVTKFLRERGHEKVFALDAIEREEKEVPVYICDAQTFPYPPGSVLLFARPCHGYFVSGTIERALERKPAAIIYVGLPKNRALDLGPFASNFRRVATRVGGKNETMYVWRITR